MITDGNEIIITEASREDAEGIAALERVCFPENEAEEAASIERRLEAVPGCFLLALAPGTGEIIGYICGIPTNEERFRDEFFTQPELYERDGRNVIMLSVDVSPEFRGRGIARKLICAFAERARAEGRERLLLTCHTALIGYYESMGFALIGPAGSHWGGGIWNEMKREL